MKVDFDKVLLAYCVSAYEFIQKHTLCLLQSSSDGTSQQMNEVFSYQPSGLESELYFDKIVIYNSIHLFSDTNTELLRFVNALTNRGRLLIIHRPFRLNTLPFPADILDRLRSSDLSLEHLISTIQQLGLEFHWEVEECRVVMSRQKWFNMIQHGGFPPREQEHESEAVDDPEKTSSTTSDGVCELMTGILRYAGDDDIEFVDRMVFITINRASPVPTTKNPATVALRQKGENKVNTFGPLEMEVTTEIKELLNAKYQQQKKWSLFD